MKYLEKAFNEMMVRNPGQEEFWQTTRRFVDSVEPAIRKNEKTYRAMAVLERLLEPERVISFRVPWIDDAGELRINKGFRVQYNSAIGPYKGGFRFETTMTENKAKIMGFEMTMKNAMTGLPFGGAKGGSDFTRDGKSNREVMAFCQSFITEMYRYIDPRVDIPTSDVGAGKREIGYLYGQYKRLTEHYDGVITGKKPSFGGSAIKDEAVGYGLVFLISEMMERNGKSLEGSRILISGAGEVALFAAEKAAALGGIVTAMSDREGCIYDPKGLDIGLIKHVKRNLKEKLTSYAEEVPGVKIMDSTELWKLPCDVALPSAYSGELGLADIKLLEKNGCIAFAEGAISPCSKEAEEYLIASDILYMPNKPASAGGVMVSSMEVMRNCTMDLWNRAQEENMLKRFMGDMYDNISACAKEYHEDGNYFAGSNIYAFERVADAMASQGFI